MTRYPVKIVCAWCKLFIQVADFTSDKPGQVSHGICATCLEKEIEKLKEVQP